ncbi:MAG: hypothetical protein AB1656_26610 [Candidatus Omnitrophota bacterium]
MLQGGTAVASLEECFDIVRSRAHGHVAAVLGMLRRLQLEPLLNARAYRKRYLVVALIAARISISYEPARRRNVTRRKKWWNPINGFPRWNGLFAA